jgi:predicted permease
VQRGHARLRSSFVVVQVGLALTLLFTAAILLKTLSGLINEPMGFDAAHILTAEIDLSAGNYASKSMWADFYRPLLDRIQALPGVRAAGIISLLPIQNSGWNESVHMAGQPPNPPNEARLSEIRFVSAGYYRVFGLHLLDGHLLDDAVRPSSERTQVVNQRFVDLYIPKGRDPVGMYMDEGDDKVRIVGVVSNVRHQIYDAPYAEMDWPIAQVPPEFLRMSFLSTMHLVVRTDSSPTAIIPALRNIYHQLDPSLPFRTPETMTQIIAESLNFERLENWLFGSFAGLAFLLAVVGLYGVISHEVQTSTRDIGVRIAVGARMRNIFGLVYWRVGVMLVTGLAAGSFATWAARKVIGSVVALHLEQDGWVFCAVLAGFGLIAAAAAFLPARTATKVDPVQALRTD